MSIIPTSKKNDSNSSLRCFICRKKIVNVSSCYQTSETSSIVCKKCYDRFSTEDLEVISQLFIAYGGYFGQYPPSEFSIFSELVNVMKNIHDPEDINIQLLHRALLHGITIQKYVEILNSLVKD